MGVCHSTEGDERSVHISKLLPQLKPLLQLLALLTEMERDCQDDLSDDFEDEEDEESGGQDEPSKDLEEDEELEQKEGGEVGQEEGMADPSMLSRNTSPETSGAEGKRYKHIMPALHVTLSFLFVYRERELRRRTRRPSSPPTVSY